MSDTADVVPFVVVRCSFHRRMKPKPGVILTVGLRWQDCEECRIVWRRATGPDAVEADETPPPRPEGWPGRA